MTENTSINQSLANLQKVIPSQVINCTIDEACIKVVSCLLSDYISQNTNISQIISQIQTSCPALTDAISNISLDTLKNLNNQENKQSCINLVIGAIMSGTTLYTTVKDLKLICKEFEIASNGLKAELVNRILDYENNNSNNTNYNIGLILEDGTKITTGAIRPIGPTFLESFLDDNLELIEMRAKDKCDYNIQLKYIKNFILYFEHNEEQLNILINI